MDHAACARLHSTPNLFHNNGTELVEEQRVSVLAIPVGPLDLEVSRMLVFKFL